MSETNKNQLCSIRYYLLENVIYFSFHVETIEKYSSIQLKFKWNSIEANKGTLRHTFFVWGDILSFQT